jgi:hypothetical protein
MWKPTRLELEYVIEPQVRQFCGPIFFTKSLQTALGNVIANASFGFLDTGSQKLLVTCHHVWDEFQDMRLLCPDLRMCLCLDRRHPVLFAPERPVVEDREFDIVTFDMQSLLPACGHHKFYPLNQIPARKIVRGDVLFFIGFPGHLRRASEAALGIGRSPFGVQVHSVDDWRILSDITNLKTEPDMLGGISGCPCFLLEENKRPQLVGFASGVVLAKYLKFTHARCLNHDGTINKNPFAP